MSWIKYYPMSRVHNQKLSSIRQQLLRHHRVRTKVKILRSSRRAAAAAATTTVVVAVLLKYVRSMYWQVICSCFSRTNCKCFFFRKRKLKCHRRQQNLSPSLLPKRGSPRFRPYFSYAGNERKNVASKQQNKQLCNDASAAYICLKSPSGIPFPFTNKFSFLSFLCLGQK